MKTFQTIQTWIDPNSTRYLYLNTLPQALPHALSYIFSNFSMVWGYLQCVIIIFIKRMCTNNFFKNMVGNAWQHLANSPKPSKSQRKHTVTQVETRVVTRSSYGNMLHYGLSMFAQFEKLPYFSAVSVSARFHKPSAFLLWNLLRKYKYIYKFCLQW